MAKYVASAHPGAITWLAARGISGEVVASVDEAFVSALKPGDEIIGNLPAHLVADVTQHGAVFRAIRMTLTPELRARRNLSVEEMEAAGAELVTIRAYGEPEAQPARVPRALPVPARPGRWWSRAGKGLITMAVLAISAKLLSLMVSGLGDLATSTGFDSVLSGAPRTWPAAVGAWVTGLPAQLTSSAFAATALKLLLLLLISYGLWFSVHRLRPLAASFKSMSLEPKKVLLQTLSPQRAPRGQTLTPERIRASIEPLRAVGLATAGLSKKDLDHLAKEQAAKRAVSGQPDQTQVERLNELVISWQQNIRTIKANLSALRHVFIIPSWDKDTVDLPGVGPVDQARIFIAMAQLMLEEAGYPDVTFEVIGDPVDNEDHDRLLDAINTALRRATRKSRIRESDIAIDATAGLKMYSIAAAVATINRPIVLQYVTNAGEVNVYDGSITLSDARWSETA